MRTCLDDHFILLRIRLKVNQVLLFVFVMHNMRDEVGTYGLAWRRESACSSQEVWHKKVSQIVCEYPVPFVGLMTSYDQVFAAVPAEQCWSTRREYGDSAKWTQLRLRPEPKEPPVLQRAK